MYIYYVPLCESVMSLSEQVNKCQLSDHLPLTLYWAAKTFPGHNETDAEDLILVAMACVVADVVLDADTVVGDGGGL